LSSSLLYGLSSLVSETAMTTRVSAN
jgi:hypothetical protein